MTAAARDRIERRRLNDRWPLPPRCSCGAIPDTDWPMCALAVAQGSTSDGVDAENCPQWQDEAAQSGWLAVIERPPLD